MLRLQRTDTKNPDLILLVKELDNYLKITDGEDHTFYNQFNGLDNIKHCLVVYLKEIPVGCGAFKKYDDKTVEIKRMYVKPEFRGIGIAQNIIQELESWAASLAYKRCVLETGDRQVEAVQFYHKVGYQLIPNYGQYTEMANSNCFEKWLV